MPSEPLRPAEIVDFAVIDRLRPELGRIVVASGGFDPLHPGHASNLLEAKKLGDTLVALVNGDAFLRAKKGKAFQDLKTRCQIVSFVRGVDYVVPFEIVFGVGASKEWSSSNFLKDWGEYWASARDK